MQHFNVEKIVAQLEKTLAENGGSDPSVEQSAYRLADPVMVELIRWFYTGRNLNIPPEAAIKGLGGVIGSFMRNAFGDSENEGVDDNLLHAVDFLGQCVCEAAESHGDDAIRIEHDAPVQGGRA